jgi:5-methylcytosine-specific restriction endonuclease McrA
MKKQYDTLVLNKLYIPIHIISWKRSISLLYQDLAKSLDQDLIPYAYDDWIEYSNLPGFDETYYNYVHSTHITMAVPDILVLSKYDRLPKRDVKFTRENIFHRDDSKCAYCGGKFRREKLTIDHILPKSKGGTNDWKNTISACKACNNVKADRTPEEAKMPLLYKPTEPRWTDGLSKAAGNKPNLRPNWSKFLDFIGA